MTADEQGFLKALKKNPKDVATHSAYADWLDEHDRPYEAALHRSKAGLSEVYYKIRRRSDGLFSNGTKWQAKASWSEGGKVWRRLTDVCAHMRMTDGKTYGGTAWNDLEVVVVEVRTTFTVALPIRREKPKGWARARVTVVEPHGDSTAEE